MNSLKNTLIILIIIILLSVCLHADENKFYVTHVLARVYLYPNAFSNQITRIPFGKTVQIEGMYYKWVKIKISNTLSGYIHQETLINTKNFLRQIEREKDIKKFENSQNKSGKFHFDEETTSSTGVKGFQENNNSQRIKKFDEETTASVGSKGFTDDIEKSYRKKNKTLRYDLVDHLNKQGEIDNIQKRFQKWRMEGSLGEYTKYFQKNKGGLK